MSARFTMTGARALSVLALGLLFGLSPAALPAQAAQAPDCLVGEWRLTNFDALVRAVLPDASNIGVALVSGDAIGTQRADGSYESDYHALTLQMDVQGQPLTMAFDGWERGTTHQQGPGQVLSQSLESEMTITMTFQGRSESTTVSGPSGPATVVNYECAGNQAAFIYTVTGADGEPTPIRVEQTRVQ